MNLITHELSFENTKIIKQISEINKCILTLFRKCRIITYLNH